MQTMTHMKLLIADDHTLFRDALVQYIERAEQDAEITVTKDFHEAYALLKEGKEYDLVLLDLRMPGMNGMEGFQKIRDEFSGTKAALMSGVANEEDVRAAMDMGAVGYFPKTLSGKALIQAIQIVLTGERFVPIDQNSSQVMPSYYSDQKRVNYGYGVAEEGQVKNKDNIGFNLTPREKEVLGYLAEGASNKEIANALGLQVVTVKLHVRGVCRKLNAGNRTQAALTATKLGLVSMSQIGR